MTAVDQATVLAPARPRLRWWREVLYVLGIYLVYSTVRNQFGSAGGPAGQSNGIAYGHALDVIQIERAVGLYVEPALQRWYLDLPASGWIGFWNVFYGTAHFLVTGFALIWLYRRDKARYPVWRNTLAFTTVFALVGFASFSLMPPRLLDESFERFGPPPALNDDGAEHGHMVDTLATYPTFWSFDSSTLKNISNQYAAMPSLHIGWSVWATIVLLPMTRKRWVQALIVLHPVATLFCIVVTANHFWLDAVGGLVILGAGFWCGRALSEWWDRRQPLATRDGRGSRSAPATDPDRLATS